MFFAKTVQLKKDPAMYRRHKRLGTKAQSCRVAPPHAGTLSLHDHSRPVVRFIDLQRL